MARGGRGLGLAGLAVVLLVAGGAWGLALPGAPAPGPGLGPAGDPLPGPAAVPGPVPGVQGPEPPGPSAVPALPAPSALQAVPAVPAVPEPSLPGPLQAAAEQARALLPGQAPHPPGLDPDTSGEHGWTDEPRRGGGAFGDGEPGSLATTALGVGLASVAAGALAWAWPSLKWLLAPLYSRTSRETVLLHDTRERIYRLVKEQPGIHAHDLAQQLGMGWGTTVHHLKVLEQHRHIVSFRDGRYRRFLVTGDQRAQFREAVATLRHPTSRRIADTVAQRPGIIQKQVCEAVGLSSSLAAWHLKRLARAGIVAAQKQGRTMQYRPGPAWEGLQRADPAAPADTA